MGRTLAPRNLPMQRRALQKREMILSVTAKLLGTVGQDDLTTIMIANKTGISVGTLYHYFPNKYSILYALAERWLKEIDRAMDDINNYTLDSTNLRDFTNFSIDRMFTVYTNQEGILPLVQLMSGVPELKSLDDNNQIAVKYCSKNGDVSENFNPNGSIKNIAGIFNKNKNILGMMPHPERVIDRSLSSEDGTFFFKNLIENLR